MATAARPNVDTANFLERITNAEGSTLVLDFDSTLQVAAPRHSSLPLATVEELIECILMTRRTRVIITSAGSAQDVLSHFRAPYPEIWGRGGRERIPADASARGVAFRTGYRQQAASFRTLLLNLCSGGPVAYLTGEGGSGLGGDRLPVRPEFHLSPTQVSFGGTEELLQFLTDWLRACAGEIC